MRCHVPDMPRSFPEASQASCWKEPAAVEAGGETVLERLHQPADYQAGTVCGADPCRRI
jgi:hypothetical protein